MDGLMKSQMACDVFFWIGPGLKSKGPTPLKEASLFFLERS